LLNLFELAYAASAKINYCPEESCELIKLGYLDFFFETLYSYVLNGIDLNKIRASPSDEKSI
jgi:hypothetical protein